MPERFRHEDVASVPGGWKVRTVVAGSHRVRVAFPPGRKVKGSGRLVSILHPLVGSNPCANPCNLRSTNPSELMVMSANNPPRRRNAEAKQQREFTRHQIRIAKDTLRMPDQIASAMGGMTKDQARGILHQYGIKFKENSPKLDKQRAARERAAAIRGRRNPRLTREQKDYWLAQKDYWENVEGAITRKAKKYAWEDLYKKYPELRRSSSNPVSELMVMGANPRVEVVSSPNPPTEEIVEEFTGREVEYLDVYNEPHMPRGRYAKLGPLIALYIKPAKGGQVQRIGASEAMGHDFPKAWGGKPPLVVCDSSAKQIYFVDGCQDISNCLRPGIHAVSVFGEIDRGNGIVELGQARRIDYQCRKEHVAAPDEDLWKHDHGEENGVLPTVLFDTKNKRLLYEGGDYRIEGPWIRN